MLNLSEHIHISPVQTSFGSTCPFPTVHMQTSYDFQPVFMQDVKVQNYSVELNVPTGNLGYKAAIRIQSCHKPLLFGKTAVLSKSFGNDGWKRVDWNGRLMSASRLTLYWVQLITIDNVNLDVNITGTERNGLPSKSFTAAEIKPHTSLPKVSSRWKAIHSFLIHK